MGIVENHRIIKTAIPVVIVSIVLSLAITGILQRLDLLGYKSVVSLPDTEEYNKFVSIAQPFMDRARDMIDSLPFGSTRSIYVIVPDGETRGIFLMRITGEMTCNFRGVYVDLYYYPANLTIYTVKNFTKLITHYNKEYMIAYYVDGGAGETTEVYEKIGEEYDPELLKRFVYLWENQEAYYYICC